MNAFDHIRRAGWSLLVLATAALAAEDRVLADFEGRDYAGWGVEGDAFGSGPAHGTLGQQQRVSGFTGRGLVNTFLHGDKGTGTLTSPEFTVARKYINFLIGGGGFRDQTCVELLLSNRVVRSATGKGRELLEPCSWDVTGLLGQKVRVRIADRIGGGWGHINVDDIRLSDRPGAEPRGDEKDEQRRFETQRAEAATRLAALGVQEIIFAVRMVDSEGHWYANFGTWSNNPDRKLYHDGGKLCRMELRTGKVTVLLDDPRGGVRDPQVHYDGKKILFSYRKGGQPYYHLYEIGCDGKNLRQLTDGEFDDLEPTYTADGGIVFCSSRCNRMVNCYYVRVAVLHRCEADGSGIRMLSSNIEQDNTPWPLPDGRILHQRWEYIDRSQVWFHHLWTMNPDGTGQMVYYGNQQVGTVMLDAKPIPGTRKVVASFSPGHGKNEHEGFVTIVTPAVGPDQPASAQRINDTPGFRDPYPLSENAFLVARGTELLLMDAKGDCLSVYSLPEAWRADDGRMRVHEPRPLQARPREYVMPNRVNLAKPTGLVALEQVHQGRNMDGVKPGEIRSLLVLEALPKPVNFSGGWEPLTYGGSFTLERVLGTVPVEADGSAYMELPALRSLFFVALDARGRSVKRMQSFFTIQPGETLGCVGCHEERTRTPAGGAAPLAMRRKPSPIAPIPGTPEVFDFPRDIQPILDRHCADCHGYVKTAKGGPRSGGVILTGDHGPFYSHSYFMLTIREQFRDGRNAGGNLPPRSIGSAASPLLDKLEGGHHGVKTSAAEQTLMRLWIESAAPYPGTYAALGTGMIGHGGKVEGWGPATADVLRRRCAECHSKDTRLPLSPGDDVLTVGFGGARIKHTDPRYRFSNHILYNLSRPELSLLLLTPLSSAAGGYAGAGAHRALFASTADADYKTLLTAIQASRAQLEEIKRFDMPGFQPNEHYLREMTFYGILSTNRPPGKPVDYYSADRAYWNSFIYRP
jgi:hypothetical protein